MQEFFNKHSNLTIRRKLRSQSTKGEAILWKYLRNRKIGFKFRRQFGIGKYIVDFYCPEIKLVIEIDGSTHYDPQIQQNDRERDVYMYSLGITVKRFPSESVFKNIKEVVQEIYNFGMSTQSYTSPNPLLGKEGAK